LARFAAAICFTRGRIHFVSPYGEATAPVHGSAFFYLGSNLVKFTEEFAPLGLVVSPVQIDVAMSTCDCGFRWRERRQIPELPNDLLADFSADRKAKSRCRPNRNPHVTLSPAGRSPRRRSGSGGREVAYKGFLDRAAIHPGSLRIPAKPPAYSRINSPANSNIISPIDSAVNPPRGSRALLAQEFDVRFS